MGHHKNNTNLVFDKCKSKNVMTNEWLSSLETKNHTLV